MIPFSKISITDKEINNILDCLDSKKICGDGKYTKLVNEWFKNYIGEEILLTTSGTSALEMAAILAGIKEGDEVIVPSFTFTSTVNSVALRGAIPVFIDIDPKTMNMDVSLIEEKITKKTKAIIPVDYAGIICDMDKIMSIAKKHNLIVIEDAAQAVGSYYKGIPAGLVGDYGCYSFHETKNYTMGEGGAIIIKNQDKYLEAEILREKGTNRSQFLKGMVDKYTWHEIGSSYLPSDILAALLYGQLERFDEIMAKRKKVWNYYNTRLEHLEKEGKLIRPFIPKECEHNAHMYYLILRTSTERDEMISEFKKNEIVAPFHYIPLHLSPVGKRFGYNEGDLPKTEEYASRLIRLPLYPDISDEEMEKVCKVLENKLGGN